MSIALFIDGDKYARYGGIAKEIRDLNNKITRKKRIGEELLFTLECGDGDSQYLARKVDDNDQNIIDLVHERDLLITNLHRICRQNNEPFDVGNLIQSGAFVNK